MKIVMAIIKPFKLEEVRDALTGIGVHGDRRDTADRARGAGGEEKEGQQRRQRCPKDPSPGPSPQGGGVNRAQMHQLCGQELSAM